MRAASVRPYSNPTSSASASACVGPERVERAREQAAEQVVVLEREARAWRRADRRGSASTAGRRRGRCRRGPADLDDEVAAAGELLEVVAGDVGVEVEALGHLAGGDAVARASRAKR